MKEKKVTVKHYLATNIKGVSIGGKMHHPIYILITALRKNTVVKSNEFSEVYDSETFESLVKEQDERITKEIDIINTMVKAQLNVIPDDFHTSLFAAMFSYLNEVSFNSAITYSHIQDFAYHDYFFRQLEKYHIKAIEIIELLELEKNASLINIFAKENQIKITEYLKTLKLVTSKNIRILTESDEGFNKDFPFVQFETEYKYHNSKYTIDDFNSILFITCFKFIMAYFEKHQKQKNVRVKYENIYLAEPEVQSLID